MQEYEEANDRHILDPFSQSLILKSETDPERVAKIESWYLEKEEEQYEIEKG
jgi:hypothetical protein